MQCQSLNCCLSSSLTLVEPPDLVYICWDPSDWAAANLRDVVEDAGIAEHIARGNCHGRICPLLPAERAVCRVTGKGDPVWMRSQQWRWRGYGQLLLACKLVLC